MPKLTLNKGGAGSGRVQSGLGGIDCGRSCASQDADYPTGAIVFLQAMPTANSTFAGWSGDGNSINISGQTLPSRKVVMNRRRTVTANFSENPLPRPDLVVQDLEFVAGRLMVRFRIKNIGGALAQPSRLRIRIEQERVVWAGRFGWQFIKLDADETDDRLDVLLPGQSARRSRVFALAPQIPQDLQSSSDFQAKVVVTADASGAVDESSESNNVGVRVGTLQLRVYA